MRILLLVYTEVGSGAGRAAYRLLQGLNRAGYDARMLVGLKQSDDPYVFQPKSSLGTRFRMAIDTRISGRITQPGMAWSNNWIPSSPPVFDDGWSPDVVNVHWIAGGYLNLNSLRGIACPQVWTLHDMWPFTGGCHYAGDCEGYKTDCGRCPMLRGSWSGTAARLNLHAKRRYFDLHNCELVAPSKWMAALAAVSTPLSGRKISCIPNGLDLTTYRPLDKRLARGLLGLPEEGFYVGFGALGGARDRRKGYDLFLQALRGWAARTEARATQLLTFGGAPGCSSIGGMKIRSLGRLHDDVALALAYSAMDCFVAPSREENLAQTVVEAQACGRPTIAFRVGGMADIIQTGVTGWLADPYRPGSLIDGLVWAHRQAPESSVNSLCRENAEARYSLVTQVERYASIFSGLKPQLAT